MDDYESAIQAFEKAVDFELSPPTPRIESARGAAVLLKNNAERASRVLTKAVNLLPRARPRVGRLDDKQINLSKFNGLASDAAALCIRATEIPDVSEALRLLELGRGVIASAYFDTRGDIGELKNKHPILAEKFESLRNELDRVTENSSPLERGSQETRRYEATKEFETTINTIRDQQGFERFLLGPSTSELHSMAPIPIVYLNASRYGADAFIIHNDLRRVPLTLQYDDLEKQAQTLLKTLEGYTIISARRDNDTVRKILDWLWDVAIEPVLKELGFTQTPAGDWPHIMWVPVGLLSLFPIHAAGQTIDRVISSYTPTLRALGH